MGQSQTFYKATLLDKSRKQPVPFATIKVLHQPFGTVTNDKGSFEVEALSSDTLLITSIGFEARKITAFSSDTIFLQTLVRELTPVVVTQKRVIADQTLGIKAKTDFRWGPSGNGEEFAQKINLLLEDSEFCMINKVTLSAKYFSSETPALLHIYSVHPITGKPDKELLSENYLITKQHFKKGKLVINLEPYDFYTNEKNVFISFQWLGYGKRNHIKSVTSLNMTFQVPDPLTYTRTLTSSNYNWFPANLNNRVVNTIFTIDTKKLK